MITDREPTPAESAKIKKGQWWNCVAALLFALTFIELGILNAARRNKGLPYFGYLLMAIGLGYGFVFLRSVKRYKELA